MSAPEVRFLGTGNAFNSDARLNQALMIRSAAGSWCIEAGPTFLYQLAKYRIDPLSIDQVFFTHFHGDHIAGIASFMLHLYEFTQNNYSVTLNGPAGVKACCKKHYQACYPGIVLDTFVHYREFPVARAEHLPLKENCFMDIYPMEHKPESLGYKFTIAGKRIAVTGDTRWNPGIPELTRQCDLAVIECTTLARSPYNHVSFEEFAENLDRIEAGIIVPIHLTDEIAKAFVQLQHPRIRVVEDGDIIRLDG